MRYHFKEYLVATALACCAVTVQAQANHLVISEALLNSNLESGPTEGGPGNSSEFLEIFNPTGGTIDLSNYYITDSNNYTDPAFLQNGTLDVGPSDNIVRFPAGTMLASGQVAVVAYTGSALLQDYFGGELSAFTSIPTHPLLFEVTDSDPAIDNMLVLNSYNDPLIPGNTFNFSRTNGGEFIQVFYWDQTSDLVKDVDIVAWNAAQTGTNQFQPKTAATVGLNGTPYLADGGTHANLAIDPAPNVVNRISLEEPGEPTTGGNGITGHDESLETVATSWEGKAMGDATPGTTNLTVPGANVTPNVTAAERDIQYPTSTQAVTITATANDTDGSIASVAIFVDSGAGFTEVAASNAGGDTYTANIGALGNNKLVKYYVVATDNQGGKGYFPPLAPGDFKVFYVADDPVVDGDIVINEILYDNPGGDAYEFVELYNTTDANINMAYYRFADGNFSYFTLPEGAEIPANGYLLLTLGGTELPAAFPSIPSGVQIYDWGSFGLNNGGDTVVLVHPNSFEFNGVITNLDEVVYSNVEPWPTIGGTNRSLELIHPGLDNALAENWRGAQPAATPGMPNTVFSPIVLSDLSRDITFPTANQAVVISVKAVPLGATTIANVKLYVDSGTGFAPVPMALSATPNVYTAQIGGFADGTTVKYYIEAENNTGTVVTLPVDAPTGFNLFLVGNTPIQTGDVVINEILYDNFEADAYEFIELHNTLSVDVDLSYFRVMDNQNIPFTFPVGSIIPANGYAILTESAFNFRAIYGGPPEGVELYEWLDVFGLANAGDEVLLIHPNQFNFGGASVPLEHVTYDVLAPWPTWEGAPDVSLPDSPNMTGRSIELINPAFADYGTNGARWAWSTNIAQTQPPAVATPGAQNSVFSTSSVADWSVY